MSKKLDLLQDLILGEDGFLIKLRMGDGLDEEKYNATCEIIKEITVEWREKDVIPKKAAILFVDLYRSMISFAKWNGEKEEEKIIEAAINISGLIREFLEQPK
ncbi:MAG TPA: hypothetical protein VF941_05760 [Clostridia bacterium]